MCFSVIVGKKASAYGYVMSAANDDWPGCPGHVHYTPPCNHKDGDTFLTIKGVSIPQTAHTFGYTYSACAYETGTRKVSWADGVNDRRVSVSMQGVYVFRNYQTDEDILEADDISILLLERAASAREGILHIGELIHKYGYSVSSIDGAKGTVSIAVADPDEGFFLELLPGGHWCAKRVQDNEIECRPNCFGNGIIDFNDSKSWLFSDGLYDFAIKERLIRNGEELDFATIFGTGIPSVNDTYGGLMNPVNTSRRWSVLRREGELNVPLESVLFSCVPVHPLTHRELMNLMRDNLEGTELALSHCPEAGLHHNPYWMTVSNTISQGGTVTCMIAELDPSLPDPLGGKIWFSMGNARLAPFVPCYIGGRGLPWRYQRGEFGEFDPEFAWWAFEDLAEICYRNYEEIANREIIPALEAMEDRFMAQMNQKESLLPAVGKISETEFEDFQKLTDTLADEAYCTVVTLARSIKGKYLCNTVHTL